MTTTPIPHSWGARFREFNPNHEPAGSPVGGQFASTEGRRVIDTAAFKAWFKNSKIVDAHGEPLKVYHGTPSKGSESNNRDVRSEQADVAYPVIDAFNTESGGITDSQWLGQGTYFTPDPSYAEEFGDRIMPVYLSIQRPFLVADDSSASLENNFRFLQSLQDLKGLPPDLALDLTLPGPKTYQDYRGETVTTSMGVFENLHEPVDKRFAVIERFDVEGRPPSPRGTGVVAAFGHTREQALFNLKYKDTFNWFLSSIITKRIGAKPFRDLLQRNGYDGVIEQNPVDGRVREIVAFHPQQIKSAIGNRGTFDPASRSITEAR